MLSSSTKEAIKVALSIVVSICLALWFQWEKPYWAAIVVVVMALNESFAHSVNKGHTRVLGTVVGTAYAFFLITVFSQDQFLFLTFFTLFLGLCLFMSSDEKHGYIFSMALTVCALIAGMGGFDNQTTFHFAVLRLQETILGVVSFTVIYRLIWPVSTEQNFMARFETSRITLLEAVKTEGGIDKQAIEVNAANINKLHQLLNLPLTGSYQLKQHRTVWRHRLDDMTRIQECLLEEPDTQTFKETDRKNVAEQLDKFDASTPQISLLGVQDKQFSELRKATSSQTKRTFDQHLQQDGMKVLQGLSMFVTCLFIWMYLPVQGGFIFPMIAAIFSCVLPTMPPSIIKDAFFGVIGTGTVILIEYVFLMPLMTELWQLALFYFVNTVAIWQVFSAPKLIIHRVLGVNLLVVLTSSALNLTPAYGMELPIIMLTNLLMVLVIGKLFSNLFCKPQNAGLNK